ncbi:MAG: YidC/Oxa1 family membrane protein insertase [Eubacteriales bacterium]|nr:YidC/Oxa1 family membrane protein insertase [Eubacteriales bacterium]
MGIIAKPLGWLLSVIYSYIGNYGITLLIVTVIVKFCLYPLYAKQIKSTAAMSSIQPKMMELQKKYANDKETLNQRMSELYKEEGFSPMGGCLPMLIQMPIIMGLFSLLRNPMMYITNDNMLFAIHEPFLWIKDLSQPDLWILPILAGVTTFISFSLSQQTMAQGPAQSNAMMKIMKYFFPITILWMARSYPSGLAIYWFGSQFIQIFFNIRMNKLRKALREDDKKTKKKKKK